MLSLNNRGVVEVIVQEAGQKVIGLHYTTKEWNAFKVHYPVATLNFK